MEGLLVRSTTETAIFSQWLHSDFIERIHYARWKKGKVDMVLLDAVSQKPVWCVEVKWSDRVISDHSEIGGLLQFVAQNSLSSMPLVTTKTKSAYFKVKDVDIRFEPSSIEVYTVGRNVLKYKMFKSR